jgi:SpoVK/Ycf46/Vps4 family AAA+-type ATPase
VARFAADECSFGLKAAAKPSQGFNRVTVKKMNADREHELEVLIRARYPIIYIVSWEERRVEESLRQVAARRRKKLYGWTVTKGVVSLDSLKPVGVDPTAKDPVQALEYVASSRDSAIFVLKDFHPFLDEMRSSPNNAVVARRLRDIATELKESRKTLVILSPVLQFPTELEKDITVLDYALPTLEELDQSLERVIRSAKSQASVKLKLSEEERERVLKAAQGLTCTEAENVFAKSLVMAGKLDLDIIVAEKKQIIRKSRILEYYESKENFDYVGGMAALKEWLRKRGLAFSERARHFGLPEPRGLLLLGVQGAGKSLLAKAVASQWKLPLLKLDMGRVFSELVGSSEQNMRTVLSTAESVAPCLLWLDELEKGLAGTASSHRSDAGTAARVFGSLLTWMQEKTSPVFVIACMTSDTVLARPDGNLIPLGEAECGPVLSADFTRGTLIEAQATVKVSPVTPTLYTISTSAGQLQCSPNHPLFRLNSNDIEAVRADALSVGDYVASPLHLPAARPPGEYLPLPFDTPPDPRQSLVNLPEYLTPSVAEWLGYLTGDGGVNRRAKSRWPQRLQWSELSHEMAEMYCGLTETLFGKRPTIRPRSTARGYYIFLDSSRIGQWTAKHFPSAIVAGGFNRRVPELVCCSPNDVVTSFLRGLFNAEGSCLRRGIQLVTTSKIMGQQVDLLLRRLDIHGSLSGGRVKTAKTKRPVWRLTISGHQQITRFMETVSFSHPEKQHKVAELMETLAARGFNPMGRSLLNVPIPFDLIADLSRQYHIPLSAFGTFLARRSHGDKSVARPVFIGWLSLLEACGVEESELKPLRAMLGLRWDRVKSIEISHNPTQVYDLHVPELHNYVAGGLIVHNTANDINLLPPEALRKGRFDEIFFIDLPDAKERQEIFAIHLAKRGRDPKRFDLVTLSQEAEGFSGAEIEQVVISGLYDAFESGREMETQDLRRNIADTVPLSQTMKTQIKALQDWACTHARPASIRK